MLSARRAVGGAAFVVSHGNRTRMTPIRRSSGVAAGSGRVSGAAASFRFPSPMALPYAAAAAAIAWTAAGLHFRNRFDKQSLMHQGQEDPTAPPPVQALSTTAAEQAPKELTRRVADAIARLTQAVYRQLRILLRLAEITGVASPLLVTYPIVARLRHQSPALYEAWWRWLIASVEYLGPACIKFTQWASSRRDLFDAGVCERLSGVQSRVAPHPERATDRALRAAFGEAWEEEVLSLEREVLGSGCIAQVYRGRLHDSGRDVAVKVLHPHVRALIEADLALFGALAGMVEALVPNANYWSIGDALRQFDGLMRQQVDMRVEAANLRRLRHNFAEHPEVAFPEPLMAHQDVLVEEFVNGEPVSSFIAMDNDTSAPLRRELAKTSMWAFLKMLIHHNYTHADLHPGNVLVQPPSAETRGRPIVYFLDAGLCTELNAASRRAFVQIFYHACRGDGAKLARVVLDSAPEAACEDPEAFVAALAEVVDRFNEGSYAEKDKLFAAEAETTVAEAEERRPAAAIGTVFDLCRQHRVKLDGALSTVVVSTFILEGLARSLDPDLHLFNAAMPLLLTALPLAA